MARRDYFRVQSMRRQQYEAVSEGIQLYRSESAGARIRIIDNFANKPGLKI
jgi:hypothetical protein